MENFLVDHALANVWCAPRQDRRLVIRPARVSRVRGATRSFFLGRRHYNLPNNDHRYHVFQIGAIGPVNYNLPTEKMVWRSLQSLCNDRRMLGRLYTHYGLSIPRKDVWVLFTEDRNIILAVKESRPAIPVDLANEGLIFELYSNAYFNSIRSQQESDYVTVYGRDIRTSTDRSQMIALYGQYKARPTGEVYALVNGVLVNALNALTMQLGDVVELVHDTSIYKVLTFEVDSLETFNSTLDSKSKYFIHPDKDEAVGETIEYKDDLDFWLVADKGNTSVGYYYQQSQDDSVRMLTHRDYSVPVSYLNNYVTDIDDFNSIDDLRIVIYFRRSGWQRSLIPDSNRIHELYKMSDTDIIQAMAGIDATLPEWSADGLESSDYTKIMRSLSDDVTRELVVGGYGYNTISKMASATNVQLTVNDAGIYTGTLPYLCRNGATVYEYSGTGLLTGVYTHNGGGMTWVARRESTRHIEVFQGKATRAFHQYQGIGTVTMVPGVDYRLYKTPNYAEGYLTDGWVDVTDQLDTDYEIVDGEIRWLVDPVAWMTCVRTNVHHYYRSYDDLAKVDGVYRLTIGENYTDNGQPATGDGFSEQERTAEIPPGKIDVWMDGYYMIPDIDYFIEWPQIVFTTKTYRDGMTENPNVVIRGTGFCNSDLSMREREDVGFVKYGRLSRNAVFNLRDDRVMQIVAGGRTYLQKNLRFEEDAVMVGGAVTNGLPYQTDPHYVTIGDVTLSGTEDIRNQAVELDGRVSDYLTVRIPEKNESSLSPIPERYDVYSPFCQMAIWLVKTGVVSRAFIEGTYTNTEIQNAMSTYEWLLDFDPTQAANLPDLNYVAIHPHDSYETIQLDLYEYRFVERINSLYLADRVDLTRFVELYEYSE